MQTWNDHELMVEYERALVYAEEIREDAGRLEQEILRRMREQGATSIPSEAYLCEVESRNTFDPSHLVPLKELLLPADLEAAWTPEHPETKTVAEKWNGTALNKLARSYGGEVKRIVDEAKVAGEPRLRFQRREGAP